MKKQILALILLFITYGLIAQDHPSVWDALPMTHSDEWNLADSIEKYRTGIIVVKTMPGKKVELEQQTHEFGFGCTVDNQPFEGRMDKENADMYKKKFLENFNVGVTARAVKWNFMEHEKGMVNFLTNDNILEWTDENHIPLRGHNFYWGVNFVQDWVKALSEEELYDELKKRAATIAPRYKGRYQEYDFNNEMIHGDYYQEKLGPGITTKMAGWILEYDPDAKLYLNDYDILTGNMLQEYVDHIKDLQGRGLPIDGIGVQGHLHAEDFSRDTLYHSLKVLAQFGLPVKITEFNIPGQRSKFRKDRSLVASKKEEEQFAQGLIDYYRICFAHPAVEAILNWGFWESTNWIPASSFYTKDWTLTSIGEAYRSLVFDEWWTRYKGEANSDGYCIIRAFFGTHKITVDGIEKTIELSKQNKAAYIEF
jgi:GH35 family endo-1,4-beta-xylanase